MKHRDLTQIMKKDSLKKNFMKFCTKRYCGENILFIESVKEYKKINRKSKRFYKACSIYTKYLMPESENRININKSVVNNIEHLLFQKSSEIKDTIFDDILLSVKLSLKDKVMDFNTMKKTKRSKICLLI